MILRRIVPARLNLTSLQEVRVARAGVQILFGFLLTFSFPAHSDTRGPAAARTVALGAAPVTL
jgi:hypothetical protein